MDINATCTELNPKCLQLMCMHVLCGCDTVLHKRVKGVFCRPLLTLTVSCILLPILNKIWFSIMAAIICI